MTFAPHLSLKKAELLTAGSEVTSGSGLTDLGVFPPSSCPCSRALVESLEP